MQPPTTFYYIGDTMRKAYTVTVDGREVVLAELTPTEFLQAIQSAGGDQIAITTQAVKSSLRSVNGKKLTYQDVLASWAVLFPLARHLMGLTRAWGSIHSPAQAEQDVFKDSWSMEVGAKGEQWTATLPSGRVVVMVPAPADTLGDILHRAEAGYRSPAAQSFAGLLDGLRRAVTAVDGAPVSLDQKGWDAVFSLKDTQLLGSLWSEINGVSGDVGEVRPAPGI